MFDRALAAGLLLFTFAATSTRCLRNDVCIADNAKAYGKGDSAASAIISQEPGAPISAATHRGPRRRRPRMPPPPRVFRVRVRVRIRVRVRVRVRLLGVVPRLRPLKSLVRHVPVLADRLLVRVTKEVAPS